MSLTMLGHTVVFILLLHASFTGAQRSQCGTLITYRQYSVILASAPQCFRNGCGIPPPAQAMTSVCQPSSPCYPLWDYLRADWQEDYCNNCTGDLACRIRGWPVLNATAACDAVSPDRWLFSGNGDCCAASPQEPFALADWVGSICNITDPWRKPFEYYGGMAREDWEEWIEPWNWTIGLNYTDRSNPPVDKCLTPWELMANFGIENAIALGSEVLDFLIVTLILIPIFGLKVTKGKGWERSLRAGLFVGVGWIVSNYVAAYLWQRREGYGDTPRDRLGLLLSSRPSLVGILSMVNVAISRKFFRRRNNRTREIMTGETRTEETLTVHGSITNMWLAYWSFQLAVGEIIIQASGLAVFYIATIKVHQRGLAGDLKPYWRGREAKLMYDGARAHAGMSILSMFALFGAAGAHAYKMRYDKIFQKEVDIQTLLPHLDAYRDRYQDLQAREPREWPTTQQRNKWLEELYELEQLVARPGDPVERTRIQRLWDEVRSMFGLPPARRPDRPELPQRPGPLPQWPPQGEYRGRLRKTYDWTRRNGRKLSFQWGRLMTAWKGVPFGPDEDPQIEFGRYAAARERAVRFLPRPNKEQEPDGLDPFILLAAVIVVINYITQWLFWAGFMQSMDYRWCPPYEASVGTTLYAFVAAEMTWSAILTLSLAR